MAHIDEHNIVHLEKNCNLYKIMEIYINIYQIVSKYIGNKISEKIIKSFITV